MARLSLLLTAVLGMGLLAATDLLEAAETLGGWTCNVAPEGESPDLFVPGRFNGGPASTVPAGLNCTDPYEVPARSKIPFWLATTIAAYQDEGAITEGGRGPSIWDTFAVVPFHTANNATGSVTNDFYHHYPQDIQLMKALGVRVFRFSISWSRLIPAGVGNVSKGGYDHYNNLINMLVSNCIEPHVTLSHWDLPQALQDAYGGWLNQQVITNFANYAETAFKLFGDRVKIWSTVNEPAVTCNNGYGWGGQAPGRCSDRARCRAGNSDTEPGICAHNILLAHAAAVPAFRRLVPGGKISLNINVSGFAVPFNSSSTEDINATERINSYSHAQYLDPLFFGDWPPERLLQDPPEALPRFTTDEVSQLRRAKPDYLAVNFYSGQWARFDPTKPPLNVSTTTRSIGSVELKRADVDWFTIFPYTVRAMLNWIYKRYGEEIIITESGFPAPGERRKPQDEALCDLSRVEYFRQMLGNVTAAVREDGVPVQGCCVWYSDDFQWNDGYGKQFGVIYVDFGTLSRYFKASSLWLANLFGTTDARSAEQAVKNAEARDVLAMYS